MEESKIILKSTLVEIIANCKKFSKALNNVRDNSALFVVSGVDEGNPSRMFVAVAGAKDVISQTLAEAMYENPEISLMVLDASKTFMQRKLQDIIKTPMKDDDYSLFDMLESAFGKPNNTSQNKQCNCPDCREKRRREGN